MGQIGRVALRYIHCACILSCFNHVRLFATLWTVARQAPLSMGSPRQEYWSKLPFLHPGDLPDPGIKPESPALEANALTSEPPGNLINAGAVTVGLSRWQ